MVSATPTATYSYAPGASPIPAATFPAQAGATDVGEASTGWWFEPRTDIQVTHLGYYDDGGDGLLHDHPAGIYDDETKRLLAHAVVRRDGPLEASFRWVKIKPLTLKAGRTYIVAAYAMPPFDPEVADPDGLTWASEIEVGTNIYVDATKLQYPTTLYNRLYLTPNFKFRVVPVPVAAAAFPAQEGTNEGFASSTNGWEFRPTADIVVTDLGYFDDAQDGLRHSHRVGIFDAVTEKLLVKTTVQPDSPLDGVFRFARIMPLHLKAGNSYVVATVSYPPFDPEVDGPTDLSFAPEIEYVGYRETLTRKFVFPAPGDYQFITANFRFVAAASPTP